MRKAGWNILLRGLTALFLSVVLVGCDVLLESPTGVPEEPTTGVPEEPTTGVPEEPVTQSPVETPETEAGVEEEGRYSSKEEVALYLHLYGRLPENYLTKRAAEDIGWRASAGNLWDVTEEMSIGGDRFGNREGLLPAKEGRQYYEADVHYSGGYRGAERLVYSNDGLIYYTGDHYASFELLYGEVEE